MKPLRVLRTLVCLTMLAAPLRAADWNQWRGPHRDGRAPESPALIGALPATGLPALWVAEEEVAGARGGGWASPIVADGKVYLFAYGGRSSTTAGRWRVRRRPLPTESCTFAPGGGSPVSI